MIKNLVTIIFLVLPSLCYSQSLKMTLEVDTCIDASIKNNVKFIVENPTELDVWVTNYLLVLYFGVYDLNGIIVPRKTTRHSNVDELGQGDYTKIPKKSKIIINWLADFFDNREFVLNQKYYIKCRYELNYYDKTERKRIRKTEFNLPKIQFDGKSNVFRICKL